MTWMEQCPRNNSTWAPPRHSKCKDAEVATHWQVSLGLVHEEWGACSEMRSQIVRGVRSQGALRTMVPTRILFWAGWGNDRRRKAKKKKEKNETDGSDYQYGPGGYHFKSSQRLWDRCQRYFMWGSWGLKGHLPKHAASGWEGRNLYPDQIPTLLYLFPLSTAIPPQQFQTMNAFKSCKL